MRPLSECVFCNIPRDEIIAENELALAFFDRYPVNQGHTLIVPKRHVETYFDATLDEKDAITRLLIKVKEKLDAEYHSDGYNIGAVSYTHLDVYKRQVYYRASCDILLV